MLKILIADDEERVRRRLINLLPWEQHGFHPPYEAANGDEALSIYYARNPDIVITDIRMPGLSGLELIRELKKERHALPVVIISGYDDFDYAQQALRLGVNDYLLKPVDRENLTEVLTSVKSELVKAEQWNLVEQNGFRALRKEWVSSVITGAKSEAELTKSAAELDIETRRRENSIVLFAIDRFQVLLKEEDEEGLALRLGIIERAISERIESLHDACLISNFPGEYLVLVRGQKISTGKLLRIAREVCDAVKSMGLAGLSAAVTEPFIPLAAAPEKFRTARRLLDGRFHTQEGVVFMEKGSAGPDDEPSEHPPVPWDQQAFNLSMEHGDLNKVEEMADAVFSGLHQLAPPPEICRNFVFHIAFAFIENLNREKVDIWTLTDEDGIIAELRESENLNALKSGFLNFCRKSITLVRANQGRGPRDVIREMQNYIRGQYQDDLTLKKLSSLFYMNPVYLGHLFRKETGINFNEFLSGVRIGQAARLLKTTDLNVYEISESVGYKSLTHFYKAFKNNFGATPNEYRVKGV